MTREERLKFCEICTNRKLDFSQGLLCSLTNKKADFEGKCFHFQLDKNEQVLLNNKYGSLEKEHRNKEHNNKKN